MHTQTASTTAVEAAGVVLFRQNRSGAETAKTADITADIEVCLIHRPHYDDWSFPKGKVKPNESRRHAAVREAEEETGIPVRLASLIGTATYHIHSDGAEGKRPAKQSHQSRRKSVTYWAAEQLGRAGSEKRRLAFSSPILPTPDETDEVLWFPLAKARKKLTYESDKRILDSFASQARELLFSGTLILLRHAKAEERKHWEGEEADRPITPRGAQDAYATTRELACFAPDTLVSSPWIRCIQTVNLYASLTHQRIIRDDRLTEAAFACKPDQALTAAADYLLQAAQTHRNIVVCLHRPVLGGIFKALKEHLKESGNHETADAIPSESPFLPTACALAITATLDGHTQKPKILNIQRLDPVVY